MITSFLRYGNPLIVILGMWMMRRSRKEISRIQLQRLEAVLNELWMDVPLGEGWFEARVSQIFRGLCEKQMRDIACLKHMVLAMQVAKDVMKKEKDLSPQSETASPNPDNAGTRAGGE